jgi:nitrate reductase gamma subunit
LPVSFKTTSLASLLGLALLLASLAAAPGAQASWFIDPAKFHASPHAEMSCLECHGEVAEQELHPSMEGLAKTRAQRFSPDKCAECHEETVSRLSGESSHAGKQLSQRDVERYQRCYVCHDPHQLVRRSDSGVEFAKGIPRHKQCGACHEEQKELPPPSDEDKECWSCHQAPPGEGTERKAKIESLCLQCHGQKRNKAYAAAPLVDPSQQHPENHGQYDCLVCHVEGAQYGHAGQKIQDCRYCHTDGQHDEAVAGDAHLGVSCEACHLDGVKAVKNSEGRIVHQTVRAQGASKVHNLLFRDDGDGEESCRRCHNAENALGAAAHILPPKGITCMPCHTATFSAGDTISIVTLLGLAFGLFMMISLWNSGAGSMTAGVIGPVFSCKIFKIIAALIAEGLFQLSLLKRSPRRWFIHALIFWPFALRFGFGLIALIMSLAFSTDEVTWDLINKNHPFTALFFDLTGIAVLIGVILAFLRRLGKDKSDPVEGLPAQDRLALLLLAAIVILGYITEGMRIAMTGWPTGSGFAFIGFAISKFIGGPGLKEVYAYFWYLHAIAWGLFVIYIPFSRMSHIIMGPINAAVNACKEEHHH